MWEPSKGGKDFLKSGRGTTEKGKNGRGTSEKQGKL